MRIARRELAALASLALVLGLGALSNPARAATGGTLASVCQVGKAHGIWNLPGPLQAGFASGTLVASTGVPVYQLEADVAPGPAAFAGLSGILKGTLTKITPTAAAPQPFAEVHGQWIADFDGHGKFEAYVVQVGPTPGPAAAVIGVIRGTFLDSPLSLSPTGWGSFEGVWKICP